MHEYDRVSNQTIAKKFYEDHATKFTETEIKPEVKERWFVYSADEFDQWAVENGYSPMTVLEAKDEIVHDGLLMKRHKLLDQINQASHNGAGGLARAFVIKSKQDNWRVVLLETHVVEGPNAVVNSVRKCITFQRKFMGQMGKSIVIAGEYLPIENRMGIETHFRFLMHRMRQMYADLEMIDEEINRAIPKGLK